MTCSLYNVGTWCVNSVAHSDVFYGEQNFDDTISPHDSIITALLTFGEGYHNFHHEFPNDYRNGIKWYHYDPTKWFLRLCDIIGLAWDLKEFSDNEIKRGILDMKQKNLLKEKETIDYGVNIDTLPVWTMEEFKQELGRKRDGDDKSGNYVIFNGVVHDVPNKFIMEHPGGVGMIKSRIGKDITAVFNGDIYNHSNAARNVLSHYRIARIYKR